MLTFMNMTDVVSKWITAPITLKSERISGLEIIIQKSDNLCGLLGLWSQVTIYRKPPNVKWLGYSLRFPFINGNGDFN